MTCFYQSILINSQNLLLFFFIINLCDYLHLVNVYVYDNVL